MEILQGNAKGSELENSGKHIRMTPGTLVKDTRPARATPPAEAPVSSTRLWLAKVTSSPWHWAAVSCVLLAISGVLSFLARLGISGDHTKRFGVPVSASRFAEDAGRLESDSMRGTITLPAEVARIAGAKEDVVRRYQDEKTGEVVQVLVLYGLAQSVFSHSPDICYPAVVSGPRDSQLMTRWPFPAPRSRAISQVLLLERGQAQSCTRWRSPIRSGTRMNGSPRSIAAGNCFGLTRRCSRFNSMRDGGSSLENDPLEALLRQLIVEINARVAEKQAQKQAAP